MDDKTMEPMAEATLTEPELPLTVIDVLFRSGGKVYFFDPGTLEIPVGSHVIIDTARGMEYGTCVAGNHTIRAADAVLPLRQVIRIATPADERMAEQNRAKEKDAYNICQQKIAEHGIDMQLVSAEYAFDGSKILFFFTADGRVDFRELVKSLAAVFRTRIELRQIGVRDKAKMVGGLGLCGRPFCCSEFLDDFQPVSIKMAKVQSLSLNPTKISGTCGRLMCCLKYEQEAYEDLIRQSPREESFVDTPDGRGTVTEVNLLRQSVKVRMEEHPEEINCYLNCDICVLRNGKAHKNDPPIPKELAPISSGMERKTRLKTTAPAEPKSAPVVLLKDAPAQPESAEATPQPKKEDRPDRQRRKKKPYNELPPTEESPQTAQPAAQTQKSQPPRHNKGKGKPPRPDGQKNPAEAKPQQAPAAKKPPKADKDQHPQHKPPKKPATPAEGANAPKPEGENNKRPYYRHHKQPHRQDKAKSTPDAGGK